MYKRQPKRFGRLDGSALIIAEYIDSKNEGDDDGDIEHYAALWDEHFSIDDAKMWIDLFGGHGYDAAKAVSGQSIDPEEFQRLPESVRTYLWEGNMSDAGKVILMGLLASMMKATARPRPMKRRRLASVRSGKRSVASTDGGTI